MPNTYQTDLYRTELYQTEKSRHQKFSRKTLFLKILQYSRENTCVNTYVEEHLCTAASLLNWL